VRESVSPVPPPETVVGAPDGAGRQHEQEDEEHIFGGGPPAWLCVPNDWFNFLEDGPDTDAARRRYQDLVRKVFPKVPPEGQREIVEALMGWRDRLWSAGFLAHGLISVPADGENSQVNWQILVTTMRLPRIHPAMNPMAVLGRMIGQPEQSYASYVESFETAMGLGMGLIGRPPVPHPGNATASGDGPELPRCGMAAALSCAPGAEYGIAVAGVSLDPEHDKELGMLVAMIAGRSTLVTDDAEPGENGQADRRAGPKEQTR
jgi:hypothetical protein